MSRRKRIDVAGATYYVVQRNDQEHPIFRASENYAEFEQVLQMVLRRAGASLHAYCWTAEAFHLALEVDEIGLGRVMQDLNSRYAHSIQRRTGEPGPFFRRRYRSLLIDPDAYLLTLIHYLHYIPVVAGTALSPEACPHTSHRAYLNGIHLPWICTRTALRLLDSLDEQRVAYREFMSRPPALDTCALFQFKARNTPDILGRQGFIESLPRSARRARSRLSLGDMMSMVSCVLGVTREQVLSRSQQHDLVLARALIAWHARERHIATLAETARYLGRRSSTLSEEICRYMKLRPELFKLDAFRHLAPLGPVGPLSVTSRSMGVKAANEAG